MRNQGHVFSWGTVGRYNCLCIADAGVERGERSLLKNECA
nr:MAG TPA: hypothetical protein [Caudoviricetes sp.]